MPADLKQLQRSTNFTARPDSAWLTPPRSKPDPEHVAALARRRTADYREELKQRGEPETDTIARAFLASLVEHTARPNATLEQVVHGALDRLYKAGYSVPAATARLKRLRERMKLC